MPTLVLLRHGQSQWNLENRFTGWWDVDLSPAGVDEARSAGRLLSERCDRRYAGIAVPDTESLKDTIARALPYYEAEIVPALAAGKRVLVAAHGNSLRGIIKHLSNIGDDAIVGLEIPTGMPIVYELG